MKKCTWDNGNKMHFESPHKTFNRQTNCICTGNVVADTQYSNYIRPFTELECNGRVNEPGHLQNWDLTQHFTSSILPGHIRQEVRELTRDQKAILYNFHHWNGRRRIDDGWVLTSDSQEYKLIRVWYINPDWRAVEAVNEAIKYITN